MEATGIETIISWFVSHSPNEKMGLLIIFILGFTSTVAACEYKIKKGRDCNPFSKNNYQLYLYECNYKIN